MLEKKLANPSPPQVAGMMSAAWPGHLAPDWVWPKVLGEVGSQGRSDSRSESGQRQIDRKANLDARSAPAGRDAWCEARGYTDQ